MKLMKFDGSSEKVTSKTSADLNELKMEAEVINLEYDPYEEEVKRRLNIVRSSIGEDKYNDLISSISKYKIADLVFEPRVSSEYVSAKLQIIPEDVPMVEAIHTAVNVRDILRNNGNKLDLLRNDDILAIVLNHDDVLIPLVSDIIGKPVKEIKYRQTQDYYKGVIADNTVELILDFVAVTDDSEIDFELQLYREPYPLQRGKAL